MHKLKENWLKEALHEYEKRLTGSCSIEWILTKNLIQLEEISLKEEKFIALDPKGKTLNSLQFSQWFLKTAEAWRGKLTFVIGGPDGLPDSCRKKASYSLSLSPLTFTGQITRLLLIEQIYRAVEIGKGSGYHK